MDGRDTKHTVPGEYHEFISKCDKDRDATHRLVKQPNGQPRKTRKYHVISGMGPNHTLGVYNNNIDSVERALMERYFLCAVDGTFKRPPKIEQDAFKSRALTNFRDVIARNVGKSATVCSLYEVRDSYRGAKWRIYDRAIKSLLAKSLTRADGNVQAFTKFEKQCLTKACRIINPRSTRYNIELGCYLKKNEKLYYKEINNAWGNRTDHTVIKGLNVVESAKVLRDKWNLFKNPVAVGLDASKFDMHVSEEALIYEHSFYNSVFKSKMLARLLNMQLDNKGTAYCVDGRVKFRMRGTRCSGDLNTSLGNCLIMCGLIFAYVLERHITAELANNGDDCVVIMERDDLDRFMEGLSNWFLNYGFRMTVETPVHTFEQIEFCQSNPMWDGKSWKMVRNVVACMKKDSMCLQPINNEKSLKKWLGAVGECGLALTAGIPIVRNMYKAMLRAGTRATAKHKDVVFKTTSMMERLSRLDTTDWEPTNESRASFYLATGVTPNMQLEYERYYDGLEIKTTLQPGGGDSVENHPIPLIEQAPVIFYKYE